MINKASILIILLFLSALTSGCSLFANKDVSESNNDSLEVGSSTEQQVAEEDKTSPDWKTYINNEYGFEVQYPKFLDIENVGRGVTFKNDCSKLEDDFRTQMSCHATGNFSIRVYDKTLDDFIEDYKDDCWWENTCLTKITSQEEYSFNGVVGTKLSGITADGGRCLDYIFLNRMSINYVISYCETYNIHMGILDSFKFLNDEEQREKESVEYFINGNELISKENGQKAALIDNISATYNYPIESKNDANLEVLGYSSEHIFFIKRPMSGGYFYSLIYYLEIDALEHGFKKVKDFLVPIDYKKFKYPNSLKIIGISSLNKAELYLVDLEKCLVPIMIYKSSESHTFFYPSFYGDDIIDLIWKNEDKIEIREYSVTDIKNISPNDPSTFPGGVLRILGL